MAREIGIDLVGTLRREALLDLVHLHFLRHGSRRDAGKQQRDEQRTHDRHASATRPLLRAAT